MCTNNLKTISIILLSKGNAKNLSKIIITAITDIVTKTFIAEFLSMDLWTYKQIMMPKTVT